MRVVASADHLPTLGETGFSKATYAGSNGRTMAHKIHRSFLSILRTQVLLNIAAGILLCWLCFRTLQVQVVRGGTGAVTTVTIGSIHPTVITSVTYPKEEDRTLAEAVQAVAVDNTVIVSIVNSGYLDFCENWIRSIEKVGFADRILLFAEDDEAYNALNSKWPGHVVKYHSSYIPKANGSAHDFGSLGFFLMTERRPDYLRAILQLGVNVFYNDLDMVWLADPFPSMSGDYDVWVQDDWEDWNGITGGVTTQMKRDTVFPSRYWRNICSCLIYLRATKASINLMQFWADIMSLKDWKPPIQDQPFFNKALNNLTDTRVGILSQEEFPPGPLFFKNDTWREAHGQLSKLVHNNWVIGHDVKKQRFLERNLWFATDFDEFGEISKRPAVKAVVQKDGVEGSKESGNAKSQV
ncbi:hypothetical protein KFL_001520250 [Klebsormidium nitens]|uniref:Nucleotide-diphospho-sugar transferase domain-containing protein n=1 Tax=Klebsormidium nitens TaxID=105231 RepID=A0A1Y1HY29_KLENI|nr:hypothetical protein KFL_001520250 [Klebsormidium nitens]|eukprot:GAQ83555.1 hypothetical protein KFL_001520250 [Klebsormidium nitens]